MERTELLNEIVVNLRTLADSIECLTDSMMNVGSTEVGQTNIPIAGAKIERVTIEAVRAVLVAKKKSGKLAEVKALILKYGGNKLTDLNPNCYTDLIKEAEVL